MRILQCASFLAGLFVCVLFSAGCKGEDRRRKARRPASREVTAATLGGGDEKTLRRNWDKLRKRGLRLLPVPKGIRFEVEPVVLAGEGARDAVIVLANDSEHGRIAADEIISRMEDFSLRKKLPVVSTPRKGAYNIVIENKWPNTFTRDGTRHPEARKTAQAYGLYPRADGIVLAGQGEIGTMYAAVTLRWLIEEQGGKVLLYPATVVDWPDYKHRHIGTLLAAYHLKSVGRRPEAHLQNMRKYIDSLFRMKATGLFRHTTGSREHSSLPDTVAGTSEIRACVRAVSEYARKRGIVTMHNGSVRLGRSPKDQDRPGFDQMMLDKHRGHYHSWARHDLHRNKARNMAAFCRECGFDLAFIHAVDSGGILDPELWSKRDALTRQKYGDDRVQADADMFNIYAEEMKQHGDGAEVVFVAYPYSADYLDEESVLQRLGMADTRQGRRRVREIVTGMKEWMLGVNRKLAPGVRMCIRETDRDSMFRYYACYPGRPMWIYWEITHYKKSIYPILSSNVRCVGAGYGPDRPQEDILWVNDIDYLWFSEQVRVAGCEYAWNTRFPGSKDYDPEYMRGGEPEVDDQSALDIAAERAAVGLWGAEAGAYMKKVLASHLSWRVAVDPKKTVERLPASKLPPLIRKNQHAVHVSCEAMDALWARVKQARLAGVGRELMDGFSYPFFVQYYAMTAAAKAYADVHLRELETMEAIRAGDMEQAMRKIAEGREELAMNRRSYEAVLATLKDEPWVIRYEELRGGWKTRRLEAKLLRPDFDALAKRFDALESNKDRLYEEYNVPAWFKDWFAKRTLVAVKAEGPVRIDGVLSEPAWKSAPPVDQFVGHRQYKVMAVPCDARLLYDGEYLYLGARLAQPLVRKIAEPKRSGGEYVFTEQVEFLFVPGKPGEQNLYQFVVDTAGNIFTMRKLVAPQRETAVSEGWVSGAKAAVRKEADGWSLELAVPLSSIGRSPRGTWHAVVARDLVVSLQPRRVETYASAFFDGKSYHTASLYSPLRFSSKAPRRGPDAPGLHVTGAEMKTRTTQRGAGSEVTFGVSVETRHPLLEVVVRAEVSDGHGRRLGQTDVTSKDFLILKYAAPRPVRIQLDNEYEGVKLKVSLTYRSLDGERGRVEKTVVLGDPGAALPPDEIFVQGMHPGTKALAVPARIPIEAGGSRLLSFERGTVEFWLRPTVDMALLPEKWGDRRFVYLFHFGPLNTRRPTSPGRNSLTITHEKKGWISFSISSPDGDRRLVHSRLPNWKVGEWHHVACIWDLNAGGKSHLALYLDGKKSSKHQWGRKGGVEDRTPMTMQDEAYPAQLGSLNSGRRSADAAFDELKIRRTPHYEHDFTPSRGTGKTHPEGLLHFAFDDNLVGHYRTGGRTGTVNGVLGAQTK